MMITQLYIERLPSGGYDVVCNDLATSVSAPQSTFPGWFERATGIASAIEILTQPLTDDLEYEDDVAGVRVGYQANGMVTLAFRGETRLVPDFMVAGAMARFAGEVCDG